MEEQGVDDRDQEATAVDGGGIAEEEPCAPSSLPGYLPWEQDLQMVSAFMDKKVQHAVTTPSLLLAARSLRPIYIQIAGSRNLFTM